MQDHQTVPVQTKDANRAIYEEGRAAAERGESFPYQCPYSFVNTGLTPSMFNEQFRAKMNEWFDGWKSWLDQHNLGLDMKPRTAKHGKIAHPSHDGQRTGGGPS